MINWGKIVAYVNEDEESPYSAKVMFSVLVPAAVGMLLKFTPAGEYLKKAIFPPISLEQQLLSDPSAALYLKDFKAEYPDDFKKLVVAIDEKIAAGADTNQIEQVGFTFMRQWVISKADAIQKAPNQNLEKIADANFALVADLRSSNVSACAQFSNTGLDPSFLASPGQIEKLGAITRETVKAAKGGESHPINRSASKLLKETIALFQRELVKQPLTQTQQQVLSGSGLGPAVTNTDKCEIGYAFANSLVNLPSENKAYMMANIIGETAKATQPPL